MHLQSLSRTVDDVMSPADRSSISHLAVPFQFCIFGGFGEASSSHDTPLPGLDCRIPGLLLFLSNISRYFRFPSQVRPFDVTQNRCLMQCCIMQCRAEMVHFKLHHLSFGRAISLSCTHSYDRLMLGCTV